MTERRFGIRNVIRKDDESIIMPADIPVAVLNCDITFPVTSEITSQIEESVSVVLYSLDIKVAEAYDIYAEMSDLRILYRYVVGSHVGIHAVKAAAVNSDGLAEIRCCRSPSLRIENALFIVTLLRQLGAFRDRLAIVEVEELGRRTGAVLKC